jgi:ferredoxin-NADP reductase
LEQFRAVDRRRHGAGSTFLERVAADPSAVPDISLKIVPAAHFHLPADPTRPIVMVAGGVGISPFRAFLQERARRPGGVNWLFLAARNRSQFYYPDELAQWVAGYHLVLRVAFSAEDTAPRFDRDAADFVFDPAPRGHLDRLMLEEPNAQALWDLLRPASMGGQGSLLLCVRPG